MAIFVRNVPTLWHTIIQMRTEMGLDEASVDTLKRLRGPCRIGTAAANDNVGDEYRVRDIIKIRSRSHLVALLKKLLVLVSKVQHRLGTIKREGIADDVEDIRVVLAGVRGEGEVP